MRIGIHVRVPTGEANAIEQLVGQARRAHGLGLEFWMPQVSDVDALTTLTIVGREVTGLRVGSSCVPIWPRHPLVVAMQALTAQAATGNRLSLGIGLSHGVMIEGLYGIPFTKPVRQMREYLEILMPLLHEGRADFEGEVLVTRTMSPVQVAGAQAPPVFVAALGPQMLHTAGRLADGTLLWMVGPRTIATHIVPRLTHAAEAAGRSRPEVVVGLPVCVTADSDSVRAKAVEEFASYGELPSYRAMLDLEGVAGVSDVAMIGDEESVAAQIKDLEEAGATILTLRPFGSGEERARTTELLAALAGDPQ